MLGLSTSQLTVTVPAPLMADTAAPVILSGVSLPTFYINSRTTTNGTVQIVCLDRMAYTDTPFDTDWITWDRAEKAMTSAITDIIAIKCGFSGYQAAVTIPSYMSKTPKTFCEGRSCADILQDLSAILCGFFYCGNDNYLRFCRFGEAMSVAEIEEHTALTYGDLYSPQGVRITGNNGIYEAGSTTYSYNTIQINSDYACQEAAADIYERIREKSFGAVSCSKCLINDLPTLACDTTFAQGGTYRIMDINAQIEKAGIICSLNAPQASGAEISRRGTLTRLVDNKIGYGKKNGNMLITPYQGTIYTISEEKISPKKTLNAIVSYAANDEDKNSFILIKTVNPGGFALSEMKIRGPTPDKIIKVSDNEVYAVYSDIDDPTIKYKQTFTAEGSGNERHNVSEKIEKSTDGGNTWIPIIDRG